MSFYQSISDGNSFFVMSKLDKRQKQDQINEPTSSNKRRRSESSDGLIAVTNITDVNDNCLEHIFKKLSFSDLLNVAGSCKRFQNAARLAFVSNYGQHMVRLGSGQRGAQTQLVFIDDEEIKVSNISICLKIMRCFGESITKLEIGLKSKSSVIRDKMNQYFNEYCAESVVNLVYGNNTLTNLTKPFNKVKTVRFIHGNFRGVPAVINKCFPNLHTFTMYSMNAVGCVLGHFPNLESLNILVVNEQQDKLATALRLNPKLKRLTIRGSDLDVKFLRYLSECSHLECLYIRMKKNFNANLNNENDSIHFKSVRNFMVHGYDLVNLDAANIAITFEQLDELNVFGNGNIFHLISKYPTISKLKYWHRYDEEMNDETMLRFTEVLPSLKELYFMGIRFLTNNIITSIKKCPLLKYVRCQIADRTEYDKLKDMMGPEWQCSIDKYDCIQLTKCFTLPLLIR